ncbi:uncharacterized protein ASCRUDRAFT_106083 [Ascoidea rubescens DSM 1968]|uniref:Uncharacterized protein n=1 Tax=Ascoidea rubescens DSM 1968 TaxID=1344418 RepID=A0A1D2VSF0_9ASCO|nr:hypothetical protein ASCRUDRAFT_106083 [Ascoidea rubescens DSM 1968]ODV64531.1 hypothetical protein ASCRUDRAFT_106083 [Ascoidea rubescens DSM 1968]
MRSSRKGRRAFIPDPSAKEGVFGIGRGPCTQNSAALCNACSQRPHAQGLHRHPGGYRLGDWQQEKKKKQKQQEKQKK